MDLVKILENIPVGTPLYSTVHGTVYYKEIKFNHANYDYSIICFDSVNHTISYTKDGKLFKDVGECILFPSKENRNWSDFYKESFKPFDKVLVRDYDSDAWMLSLFAFIDKFDIESPYCTINGDYWKQCICYESNEHLLGVVERP